MRKTLLQMLMVALVLLPGLASATVAYVPVWRESGGGARTWDGVHVYDLPSLRLLQVRRELPPSRGLAVSNDHSRLYLWGDDLHVYALPGLTHRRTWRAFAEGTRPTQLAVEHPLRPGTVIFNAHFWFDTESGVWSTVQGIDSAEFAPMQISDDRRWLTVRGCSGGFPPACFGSVVVIDLTAATRPRSFLCGVFCSGVVAFGGRKLVTADLLGGGAVYIRNLETGAIERRIPWSGSDLTGADLVVDESGDMLIGLVGIAGAPGRLYRFDGPDGDLTLLRDLPTGLFDVMRLGSDVVLLGGRQDRIDSYDLHAGTSGALTIPGGVITPSGPWLAPVGPASLAVPVSAIAWEWALVLGLVMLVIATRRIGTPGISLDP